MKRQKAFDHLRAAKEKIETRRGEGQRKTVPEPGEIPKQRVLHHKDHIINKEF
jgi:hypothetical protein